MVPKNLRAEAELSRSRCGPCKVRRLKRARARTERDDERAEVAAVAVLRSEDQRERPRVFEVGGHDLEVRGCRQADVGRLCQSGVVESLCSCQRRTDRASEKRRRVRSADEPARGAAKARGLAHRRRRTDTSQRADAQRQGRRPPSWICGYAATSLE